MNWFKLNIIWMLVGGLLFLLINQGQAFVSPQHYEKMKMQNQQKTRGTEKVQPQVSVVNQVHQPNPDQPGPANPVQNNHPGDRK